MTRTRPKETGWTSTIEIDQEPGTVTSRKTKNLLELEKTGDGGVSEHQRTPFADTDNSSIFTFQEQTEDVGSESDQGGWEPVVNLDISSSKLQDSKEYVNSVGGTEKQELESPQEATTSRISSDGTDHWDNKETSRLSLRSRILSPQQLRDKLENPVIIEGPLQKQRRFKWLGFKWLGYSQAHFRLDTSMLYEFSHSSSEMPQNYISLDTTSIGVNEKSLPFWFDDSEKVWYLKANSLSSFESWQEALHRVAALYR